MRLSNLILITTLATVSQATTLRELIDNTLKNNENLKSSQTNITATKSNLKSVSNTYNPNLVIGANITRLDGDTRAIQVGTTSVGFVSASIELYNGDKNSAIKKQNEYLYRSAIEDGITDKKTTILNLVTLFFKAKTIQENIIVFQEKSNALKAQYERIKTKYDIQMATKDEVLKLQSEYETNNYTIEELKYQQNEVLQNLSLLSGIDIDKLEDSSLPNIKGIHFQPSENIKSLQLKIGSLRQNTKAISSINKPQIKLEDRYSFYDYDDYNQQLLKDLPNQQNQLMLSINFNLFNTATKHKIQSSKLSVLANKQKLNYLKNQEKMKFDLAKRKLDTLNLKIRSLKSAVEMGNSVYKIVKDKYQGGIVDNITYLDALSKKIYNLALYKQALNDYEIAKANYYFASGIEYKKILEGFQQQVGGIR
jgi:outer membrane protein TolC